MAMPPQKSHYRSKAELNVLSSDFLQYYHDGDHPLICTRDSLGQIFSEFMKTKQDFPWNTLRRTESLVMARMKQRKWMRVSSNRGGQKHDVLVVRLVGEDRLTFPDLKDVQTVRELLKAQAQDAERDKYGVSLQVWQDGHLQANPSSLSAAVGKPSTFVFQLLLLTNDAEPNAMVTVDSVELRGPHSHRLHARDPETVSKLASLPTTFGRDPLLFEYTLEAPRSIGLQKIRFHVSLEKDDSAFEICRSLLIACGNPELDQVLQPKSPYQPRRPRKKGGPKAEAVHWPEEASTSRKAKKSDLKLGKYSIPKETRWLLDNKELQGHLDTFDWSPKTTEATTRDDNDESFKSDIKDYGNFWSQLLYASEYQSLIDIELFDMENVKLQRAPNNMFALAVPGLAEGRPSVLRGDMINLNWKNQLFKGRVHSTQLLQVILQVPIKFSKAFNPSVDRVDRVRFTFSRMTHRTSHQACLDYASQYLGTKILEPTLSMIDAHRASSPPRLATGLSFANRNLNPEQQQAVFRIVQGNGGSALPYILFGPPGTGKTTVVVETVYQLASRRQMKNERRPNILLLAPSNDASDVLVQRLSQYFPPKELVRVLAYSRRLEDVSPGIRPYTSQLGEDSILEAIGAARIVVSTVNLAARFIYMGVGRGHFNCVLVDEAGHATEPELIAVAASLMDMKSATTESQLILAGDPKQLGPITTSKICESYGFGISLLERLSQRSVYQKDRESGSYPPDLVTKLVRNYRSHPVLLKLPNELYYDGELQSCGDVLATHSLCRWEHLPSPGFPILFHSINGRNLREGNSPSWFNPEEAQQVVAYVDLMIRESRPPMTYDDIGIITPYARQAQKIRAALEICHPGSNIKVGSVETFQGQERRVIILSTVRSEPELFFDHDTKYNLGFVAHPKRFNVAMTRAKALLIVVGCPSVLALDRENWLPFLLDCHYRNAWVGDPWDPRSATEPEGDAGDEFVHVRTSQTLSQEGWDVVQAEETYGYIHREE